jgi:hypothetical protein
MRLLGVLVAFVLISLFPLIIASLILEAVRGWRAHATDRQARRTG